MIWRENWKPYTALVLGVLAILMVFWYAVPVRAADKICGTASWYGGEHHGRTTASGQVFDQWGQTAAHLSWPFGTKVRVSARGKSTVVTITDRGGFGKYNRIIDLSRGSFRKLAHEDVGLLRVCLTRLR
jgi:rare lipoprotein A